MEAQRWTTLASVHSQLRATAHSGAGYAPSCACARAHTRYLVEGELSDGRSCCWKEGLPFFPIHVKMPNREVALIKSYLDLSDSKAHYLSAVPCFPKPAVYLPATHILCYHHSDRLLQKWQQFYFPCIHDLSHVNFKLFTARDNYFCTPWILAGLLTHFGQQNAAKSGGAPFLSPGLKSSCLSTCSLGTLISPQSR